MTCIRYLITIVTIWITLIGCSISNNWDSEITPSNLYLIAQKKLQENNFRSAIMQLEVLCKLYPFGPYSQQAQLDLIYAYYKNSDLIMAQDAINRFVRFNPTHPNIDYVLYMKGLSNMALDKPTLLQRFFRVDRSDRDPDHAQDAYHNFIQLLHDYPNSQYKTDIYKHLVFLKNRLAKYELSIAKFYMKRGAYIAVINRIKKMLENYPDTNVTKIALSMMENAYRKLLIYSEADKVEKIIIPITSNKEKK